MERLKLAYPFLFAVLPILNTLTRNPGGSRPGDVAVVIAVLLLACAAAYLLVGLALGGKWSSPTVPLIVLAGFLWLNSKQTLASWAHRLGGGGAGLAVVGLALAVTAGAIWWLSRRPRYLGRATTFLALTGLIMTAWLGLRFATDLLRARAAIRQSVLVKELAKPVPSHSSPTQYPDGTPPDIYLIVLDEYANSKVLQERFQFDNRAFEDSLRHLGFTIPTLVRSNYVHTLLSLPSLLNFSHLSSLSSEIGRRSTDATIPNYLLENNRSVAFLKSRGYQFLFFPSRWWPSTEHNANADWEFKAWTGFHLGREATRSDLRRSYIRSTALGLLLADDTWDGEHVKRTLQGLEQVPARAEPTFAFAHIVSPHWPYVFTADCHSAGRKSAVRSQAYAAQLQCVNKLVLKTVTTIIQHSPVPPIILLQGDHGTNLLRYSSAKSANAVSPEQARERFGAFGAYYLPEGGGRLFQGRITIVNVFQKVLSHYFGAEIPPAPDELYMSLERTPYDFVRVDPSALAATTR
jgi:sulfatase-like protein